MLGVDFYSGSHQAQELGFSQSLCRSRKAEMSRQGSRGWKIISRGVWGRWAWLQKVHSGNKSQDALLGAGLLSTPCRPGSQSQVGLQGQRLTLHSPRSHRGSADFPTSHPTRPGVGGQVISGMGLCRTTQSPLRIILGQRSRAIPWVLVPGSCPPSKMSWHLGCQMASGDLHTQDVRGGAAGTRTATPVCMPSVADTGFPGVAVLHPTTPPRGGEGGRDGEGALLGRRGETSEPHPRHCPPPPVRRLRVTSGAGVLLDMTGKTAQLSKPPYFPFPCRTVFQLVLSTYCLDFGTFRKPLLLYLERTAPQQDSREQPPAAGCPSTKLPTEASTSLRPQHQVSCPGPEVGTQAGLPVSCRGLKHQGTSGMLESKQQPLLLHCSAVTSG